MPKCIPRNDCLPFLMRFFLVMEVLIGIAFIVFALVLQTPPKAAVPMCALHSCGRISCVAGSGPRSKSAATSSRHLAACVPGHLTPSMSTRWFMLVRLRGRCL